MKVCIVYGWAEGPWLGKLLRSELRKAGFSITKDPHVADVIIAHSGGGYLLPLTSKAKLVLLVGFPFWPGKHPMKSLGQKIYNESKDVWWFEKTFANIYYFITRPKKWFQMWDKWNKQLVPDLPKSSVLLVRNDSDYFMHPSDFVDLASDNDWNAKSLPGEHDDIWIHPKSYIELIKKTLDTR